MKTHALRHAALCACACLLAASPALADDAAVPPVPDVASGIFADYRAWQPPVRIDWRAANDRVAGFETTPDATAAPADNAESAPMQHDPMLHMH